jgi:hypothetical protein
MPAKKYLTDEQIEVIKHNYGLISDCELARMIKTTHYTLTKNIKRLNIIPNAIVEDIYNFDNGRGFFDINKYSKIAF